VSGEKVNLIVHDALAASVVPQVVDAMANLLLSAPVRVRVMPVKVDPPVFVRVTTCCVLVVAICAVKVNELGESDASAPPTPG